MTTECCGCGVVPCDCYKPIWNYRIYMPGREPAWNINDLNHRTRPRARISLERCTPAAFPSYRFGPLQRMTEPPYKPCALPWCGRDIGDAMGFCSTNCADAYSKNEKAESTYHTFRSQLCERMKDKPRSSLHENGLLSEDDWALDKMKAEQAAIKQAWSALRTEPTQGDPRHFAYEDDE